MLVLARKLGERIVIGKDVIVTVLSVKGNVIRIGIVAPRSITVHREEVYNRIHDEIEIDLGEVDLGSEKSEDK